MNLLLAVVTGSALAGGVGDALSGLMSANGATDLAVVCYPLGGIVRGLATLPAEVRADMPPQVSPLFSEAAAQEAGFDLSGIVAAGITPDAQRGWAMVPFVDDPARIDAMLSGLNLQPYNEGGGQWELMGGRALAAHHQGSLHVRIGEPATGAMPDPALFAGLPEGEGCALYLDAPDAAGQKAGLGNASGALWMPFAAGEEALLRVKIDAPAPDVLRQVESGPVGGSSSEAPTLVAALGVSLGTLLEDPLVTRAMELEERQARKAARFFDVGPGTTIAVFGEPRPNTLDWVAVVPTQKRSSPVAIARRARKAMRKLEMEVDRGSRTAFVARSGETTIYAASADGRLVLGRDPMRVTEAASGVGRSWLEGANLDRIQRWPISVWTGAGLASFQDMPEGFSMDLGLRADAGIWEIGVRFQGGPSMLEAIFEGRADKGGPLLPGMK